MIFASPRNRIPVISDSDLLELSRWIAPLVVRDGDLRRVKIEPTQKFLRNTAFAWEPELEDCHGYARAGRIVTYHTYGAPVFVKPSAAEVIAQIREQVNPAKFPFICGFSCDSGNAWHVEPYHVIQTTIYSRHECENGKAAFGRVTGYVRHGGEVVDPKNVPMDMN